MQDLPLCTWLQHFLMWVETLFLGDLARGHIPQWAMARFTGTLLEQANDPLPPCFHPLQVLRYFDYVFTGVFTFEMVIKVSARAAQDSALSRIPPWCKRLTPEMGNTWCVCGAARKLMWLKVREESGESRAGR